LFPNQTINNLRFGRKDEPTGRNLAEFPQLATVSNRCTNQTGRPLTHRYAFYIAVFTWQKQSRRQVCSSTRRRRRFI